jgi:outer membrane protein assembly factor BamB
MNRKATLPGLLLLTAALLASSGRAGDWPAWRGPGGQGISDEKDLPLRWDGKSGAGVLWKVRLPGTTAGATPDQNQSSPIVSAGRVFVTVSYWPAGISNKEMPQHHVLCYRAADGKPLWDTRIPPGPWSRASDLRGGYTAPTPACDGERVYVVFGSSVLAALDLEGKLLWRKEIVPTYYDVCVGSSPVVFDGRVLFQCDQVGRTSRLLAFDGKSGKPDWEQKRPDVSFGHSTPVVVRVEGKPHLLVAASNAVQGVDPRTGKLLWWCQAKGDTVSPVYGHGLVYLDSGRGGGGVAVAPTGRGDVTKSLRKWAIDHVPEGFSSPLVAGPYLYRLCGANQLRCYRLEDGKLVFDERLSGVSTAASPLGSADERIYLASAGVSYVLRAGPRLQVLARNDLGDPSQCSPAAAGGRIYLKGRNYLWCVGTER